VGGRTFLFDAGTGVMRQMKAADLPISGPEATFITHLHSDHTLGYPDLILTSWVMRRRQPLAVFGPSGLQKMTDDILAAWRQDIRVRIEGLEKELPDALAVEIHEVRPGVVYRRDGVRITAFPVDHGIWEQAFGYRVETPDRTIVISGDTRPCAALVEAARGVDVLVHEAYIAAHVAPEDRPGGDSWPQYMKEYHTSGEELGRIAAEAGPGLLVVTHAILGGGTEEELIAGIRRGGYAGPVIVGQDLGRY
jgi:ribonuclease Z